MAPEPLRIAGVPLCTVEEVLTFLRAQLAHYQAELAQSRAQMANYARLGNETQDNVTVLESTVTGVVDQSEQTGDGGLRAA